MIYLVIQKSADPEQAGTVLTAHWDTDNPTGRYNPDLFKIIEWHGDIPATGDPDPTWENPEYDTLQGTRRDWSDLANLADTEISWLEDTLENFDALTTTELREVIRRLLQENRRQLLAWRYVFRRWGALG